VKFPSILYGKPGRATLAVRKYVRAFVAADDYGAFDAGPLLDTREVEGLILTQRDRVETGQQDFHCYLVADELSNAVPMGASPAAKNRWLMASLESEWRFACTLGGTATVGLPRDDKVSARKYLEAAIHHWPAIAAERARFVSPATGADILSRWPTLWVALEVLGLPSIERMKLPNREPQALFDAVAPRLSGP
jgi:hypothetical protein